MLPKHVVLFVISVGNRSLLLVLQFGVAVVLRITELGSARIDLFFQIKSKCPPNSLNKELLVSIAKPLATCIIP